MLPEADISLTLGFKVFIGVINLDVTTCSVLLVFLGLN